MQTLTDIASEATGLADQYANNHNSITKKELTPLYQSIGDLAKAVQEHAGNSNAALRDLVARVEKLEAESATRPAVVAKSFVRKVLDHVRVQVSR